MGIDIAEHAIALTRLRQASVRAVHIANRLNRFVNNPDDIDNRLNNATVERNLKLLRIQAKALEAELRRAIRFVDGGCRSFYNSDEG